jgi:hypothetical protein
VFGSLVIVPSSIIVTAIIRIPRFDDGAYLLAIWMQKKIGWLQNGNQIPGLGTPFHPVNPGVVVTHMSKSYSDPVCYQICLAFPPYEP